MECKKFAQSLVLAVKIVCASPRGYTEQEWFTKLYRSVTPLPGGQLSVDQDCMWTCLGATLMTVAVETGWGIFAPWVGHPCEEHKIWHENVKMQSLLLISCACCLGTWAHCTSSPRNKGHGAPNGKVPAAENTMVCRVYGTAYFSPFLWNMLHFRRNTNRDDDLLSFSSRACSIMA